ncbi:TPA: hypothetical protein ACMY33_001248 [Yersinia enterocolitica]|nr:hypothetical protein [Yersinia enterocolitica]
MAETVIVGCKLPHGLNINIDGKSVVLNGSNSCSIAGGYGLTEGVDKDLFDRFLSVYADAPYVKNQLVFAQGKHSSATAQANEQKDIQTGLEGLNPDKPAPGIEPVKGKDK